VFFHQHSGIQSQWQWSTQITLRLEQPSAQTFEARGSNTPLPNFRFTADPDSRKKSTMGVPADLSYTTEHEWIRVDGDTATVGITDYAAHQLGDVVFVDLPKVGATVNAGAVVGEIESTKSVGELFAPFNGEVVAANDAVVNAPELVNQDPFGDAWLIKVRFEALPDGLLDAAAYDALVAE
jgi:glycine cleavage system H protein